MVALLDEEVFLCLEAGWSPKTRSGYTRGWGGWLAFLGAVGVDLGVSKRWNADEREQWALRFGVWLLRTGMSGSTTKNTVSCASAVHRALGLGSLLAAGGQNWRRSRLGMLVQGDEKLQSEWRKGGQWVEAGTSEKKRRFALRRPLTVWELDLLVQYWMSKGDTGKRWAAVIVVAYFCCWRPSQYCNMQVKGRQWRRWLVRQGDMEWDEVKEKGYMELVARTGKNKKRLEQTLQCSDGRRSGDSCPVHMALEWLQSEQPGAWLAWKDAPTEELKYSEIRGMWSQGVLALGLQEGVETLYALRRGGATYWYMSGLDTKAVAQIGGWTSAEVRRYILVDRWVHKV